jgi:hypothetical protein
MCVSVICVCKCDVCLSNAISCPAFAILPKLQQSVCGHVCMSVCVCVRACVCTCLYMCLFVNMCVCVRMLCWSRACCWHHRHYIVSTTPAHAHAHTHAHSNSHVHTHTHTHTHTHLHTLDAQPWGNDQGFDSAHMFGWPEPYIDGVNT